MANGNGNKVGPEGSAPRTSGGRGAGFHKGSSGSPFHLETYGATGLDPGDADYDDGPRVGPGVFAKRVTPEYDRSTGRNGKNGR